jgi:glycosyltransferase involved in cell wall biosynthesis
MNRVYRLVWSHVHQGWAVGSEHTAARGKQGRFARERQRRSTAHRTRRGRYVSRPPSRQRPSVGGEASINVVRAPATASLGALRNLSVASADGEFVCQWDDDDRYHPCRLERQSQRLRECGSDFCFMADQLHYFSCEARLYWDDWTMEGRPLDLIQGTLFARRNLMPAYPDRAIGEDTPHLIEILRRGHRIARLQDEPYLHVYVFHGANAWDQAHHTRIAQWKHVSGARLLNAWPRIRQALRDFDPPLGAFAMPSVIGRLESDNSEIVWG